MTRYYGPLGGNNPWRAPIVDRHHGELSMRDVARHEAAHAMVALVLGESVHRIMIDDEGGRMQSVPPGRLLSADEGTERVRRLCSDPDWNVDRRWGMAQLAIMAAGRIAQEKCGGGDIGCDSDDDRSWALAQAMTDADDEAERLLGRAERRAKTIVEDHWDAIVLIGAALDREGELSGAEIARVLRALGVTVQVTVDDDEEDDEDEEDDAGEEDGADEDEADEEEDRKKDRSRSALGPPPLTYRVGGWIGRRPKLTRRTREQLTKADEEVVTRMWRRAHTNR